MGPNLRAVRAAPDAPSWRPTSRSGNAASAGGRRIRNSLAACGGDSPRSGGGAGEHRRVVRRTLVALVVGAVLLTGGTAGQVRRGSAVARTATSTARPTCRTRRSPWSWAPRWTRTARRHRSSPPGSRSRGGCSKGGKVRAILVSGDNMNADYNEPDAMQRWLVDRGVPAQQGGAGPRRLRHVRLVRAGEAHLRGGARDRGDPVLSPAPGGDAVPAPRHRRQRCGRRDRQAVRPDGGESAPPASTAPT